MRTITCILGVLTFVFTASAADMTPSPAKSMETEAPASEAATSTAAPAAEPVSGTVARAIIASGVENREPTDSLTHVTTATSKIYYFTELRDMQGQTVTHRWEYNGKVMAEVPFQIGGSRWRVFSSKNLLPGWTGDWKVSVIAANGSTLVSNTFTYSAAPEPSGAPAEMSKEMPTSGTEEQKSEAPAAPSSTQ